MFEKIMHYFHVVVTFIIMIICLLACSKSSGWSVEGTVDGAADSTIYIEMSNYENWYVVDSVRTDANGNFSYSALEGMSQPEIVRLRMGGKYIYLPVDSIETVTVNTTAKSFDRGYKLAGNSYAAPFVKVDSLISSTVDAKGSAQALLDNNLKDALNLMVNRDTTCLVSFYIVNKNIDGKPLYSPASRRDVAVIGNAANNYARLRPNDTHADYLAQWFATLRRELNSDKGVQMEATLSGRPNVMIVRYDAKGTAHDFDKVVNRGTGVTVLNFTRYDGPNSQANTVALNELYESQKANGLEIYQIAFDPSEAEWKQSAANMPWIAVWNAPTDGYDMLVAYNVDPVNGNPVSFVFNRAGEIVARVTDPAGLAAAVAKAQ